MTIIVQNNIGLLPYKQDDYNGFMHHNKKKWLWAGKICDVAVLCEVIVNFGNDHWDNGQDHEVPEHYNKVQSHKKADGKQDRIGNNMYITAT